MAYVDVTDATFETEVINRSFDVPVVVDLWAPWCGPCRTLGPIIERVVDATAGRVLLTKVNVDENPQISATFRVQSIPAVYALRDRKVVDNFVGALPEAQVKQWVARLSPPKSDADVLVEAGDEASLRKALSLEPGHEKAVLALAELLVGNGGAQGVDEALALLARIPESAETRRIAALARVGAPPAGAGGTYGELDGLLDQVRTDEAAKQRFLDLLEVLGDDPKVGEYRRKLASRLF